MYKYVKHKGMCIYIYISVCVCTPNFNRAAFTYGRNLGRCLDPFHIILSSFLIENHIKRKPRSPSKVSNHLFPTNSLGPPPTRPPHRATTGTRPSTSTVPIGRALALAAVTGSFDVKLDPSSRWSSPEERRRRGGELRPAGRCVKLRRARREGFKLKGMFGIEKDVFRKENTSNCHNVLWWR